MNRTLASDATPLAKRSTPCTEPTIGCDSMPSGVFVNRNPDNFAKWDGADL